MAFELPNRVRGRAQRHLQLESLEPRHVLISEFMASNSTSLLDGDGESSDWIEIYNGTSSQVDLAGWHLTDDQNGLSKWAFPASPQAVLDPDVRQTPPSIEVASVFWGLSLGRLGNATRHFQRPIEPFVVTFRPSRHRIAPRIAAVATDNL